MRRNPDGSLFTWYATRRVSGEQVLVDDRIFDPAIYESAEEAAGADERPEADDPTESTDTPKGRKRTKAKG